MAVCIFINKNLSFFPFFQSHWRVFAFQRHGKIYNFKGRGRFFQEFTSIFLYCKMSRVTTTEDFFYIKDQTVWTTPTVYCQLPHILPFALLRFPESLPFRILIRLHYNTQILILPNLTKCHTKLFKLLFSPHTLFGNLETSRAVNKSFSNFSSSYRFLSCDSASSWALVAS